MPAAGYGIRAAHSGVLSNHGLLCSKTEPRRDIREMIETYAFLLSLPVKSDSINTMKSGLL